MKLSEWNSVVEFIKEFKEREEELSKKITRTGNIPDEIINRSKCKTHEHIEELDTREQSLVEAFLNWYKQEEVEKFVYRDRVRSEKDTAYVEYSKENDEENSNSYPHIKPIKETNKLNKFFTKFASTQDNISIEGSLKLSNEDILEKARKKVKVYQENEDSVTTLGSSMKTVNLVFCSEEYKEKINRTKCGCLKKEGRIWKHSNCKWKRGLFTKIAEEHNIKTEYLLEDSFRGTRIEFYLPKEEVIISEKDIDEDKLEGYNPKLLVLFCEPSNIVNYLEHDCDILVVSEEGNRFVDSDREIEDSLEEIINRLVRDLMELRKDESGKDHDRIQSAMMNLGQEMGFFPEEEYGITGLKADIVWRERNEGDITVCGEIETSAGWKKDILSTWEPQPELAVLISTRHKTNKIAEDLAELSVMEFMPHKFLFLNFKTEDGFLFEGNEPIAKYTIGEDINESKEESFSIEQI